MNLSFFNCMRFTCLVSLVVVGLSVYKINNEGLKYGIEFMGGTEVVLDFNEDIKIDTIRNLFAESGFSNVSIQNYGNEQDNEFLIRLPIDKESQDADLGAYRSTLKNLLENNFSSDEYSLKRIDFIGPKVGKELIQNGIYSIIFGSVAILFYVFFRFSFSFALAAVSALFHDFIITTMLVTLLDIEITLSTIAALLTVIGYSVNDTIVIFDRVRENMKVLKSSLNEVIDTSILQTLSRTILTVLTVLIVLVPLYFFGGVEIEDFALVMIMGVIIVTYSSILFAPYVMYLLNKGNINKNV